MVIDPGLGGRGRFPLRALLGLLLMALLSSAGAQPCGRPGYGLSYSTEPEISGGLFVTELVMTDAPTETLDFLPVIVVDGQLVAPPEPIRLACAELIVYRQPIPDVAHTLHWALLRWPLLPQLLLGAPVEIVMASYPLLRFRQDRPSPLVEVAFPKRSAAIPRWPLAAPTELVSLIEPGDLRREDGATWVPHSRGSTSPGNHAQVEIAGLGTLARANVGTEVAFELSLYTGEGSGGPLALVCLFNGQQINAFSGHPYVTATAVPGGSLIVMGSVVVPGPGWHQLQCLVLDDDALGTHPTTFMRPLDEAYLWGD